MQFYHIYPPQADRLCNNWLPLFKICNAYDAFYTWFNHLKQQSRYISGYVIMPGHVNAITGKSINTNVSNGKRFIIRHGGQAFIVLQTLWNLEILI